MGEKALKRIQRTERLDWGAINRITQDLDVQTRTRTTLSSGIYLRPTCALHI